MTQAAQQYLAAGAGGTTSKVSLTSTTPDTSADQAPSTGTQTAAQYIAAHHLDASFAVADSDGQILADDDGTELLRSASITQAMILVAVLRHYAHQPPPPAVAALLEAMIEHSDDAAANAAFKLTSAPAIERVAGAAHMTAFELQTTDGPYALADSLIDADDQARFFELIDQLIPDSTRGWALGLLSHSHSDDWGIVDAAEDGTVYSESGSQPEPGQGGWTVVQDAQIAASAAVGLAVLTQHDPSEQSGINAIDAISQRALAPEANPPSTTPCAQTTLGAGPDYLTPGSDAVILPNGQAAAPADAPAQVQAAIAAANEIISRLYVYGGGHDQSLNTIAASYDCSSAVSFLLHGAALLSDQPEDSTGLESYGDPGPGQWITVYANGEHTFVAIAGIEFDTSSSGNPPAWTPPGSGPRWRPNPTGNLADGLVYVVRHPPGL